MRSRLLPRALAPLLACALLAGCSDDPEPQVADPPPSTPGTSTTASGPSEPTTSPTPDKETAEEFVVRWQELAEEMQQTGQVDAYLNHTRGCRSCDSFANTVRQIYASGGSITGGAFAVRDFQKVGQVEGVAIFEYILGATPTVIRRPGEAAQRYPGGENKYQINLVKQDGTWIVTRISGIPL